MRLCTWFFNACSIDNVSSAVLSSFLGIEGGEQGAVEAGRFSIELSIVLTVLGSANSVGAAVSADSSGDEGDEGDDNWSEEDDEGIAVEAAVVSCSFLCGFLLTVITSGGASCVHSG